MKLRPLMASAAIALASFASTAHAYSPNMQKVIDKALVEGKKVSDIKLFGHTFSVYPVETVQAGEKFVVKTYVTHTLRWRLDDKVRCSFEMTSEETTLDVNEFEERCTIKKGGLWETIKAVASIFGYEEELEEFSGDFEFGDIDEITGRIEDLAVGDWKQATAQIIAILNLEAYKRRQPNNLFMAARFRSPSVATHLVRLRTPKGKYMTAEGGGGGLVNADRSYAGKWQNFRLIDLNGGSLQDGDRVKIVAHNGKLLYATGGGGSTLTANGSNYSAYAIFTVERVYSGSSAVTNGTTIGLRTYDGHYLSAVGQDGRVNAEPMWLRGWENFVIEITPKWRPIILQPIERLRQ